MLLKTQGTLEKSLKAQHIDVTWHEFPSGLPLLEALNVGNVDISADIAGTVPILDVPTVEAANAHRTYKVEGVQADQLGEQQKIADTFLAAGLLPKAVDAKDVDIWKP